MTEENDIIILSLVRSNQEESIGFLRIENRICVALSRAKMGFYLIGNMKVLEGKSKVWNQISRILDHDDQIGSSFELKCEVHNTIRKVNMGSTIDSFQLETYSKLVDSFRLIHHWVFPRKEAARLNAQPACRADIFVCKSAMHMTENISNSDAMKIASVLAL